jgi:hypothetical protein
MFTTNFGNRLLVRRKVGNYSWMIEGVSVYCMQFVEGLTILNAAGRSWSRRRSQRNLILAKWVVWTDTMIFQVFLCFCADLMTAAKSSAPKPNSIACLKTARASGWEFR